MIRLACKPTSLLKAYRVCLELAFLVAALGKAILHAVCGPLGHARLGKTPLLLREKHIV
jgi:hypothetical protein